MIDAWLLVLGPLYQAVLELQEEDAADDDSPTSNCIAPSPRASSPVSDGRTWRVAVTNTATSDGYFIVHATWARRVENYAVVGAGATNPALQRSSATVSCPAGTVALGGGGTVTSSSTRVVLGASPPLPSGSGWRMDADNASRDGNTATAASVCGAAPTGYAVKAGPRTSLPRVSRPARR